MQPAIERKIPVPTLPHRKYPFPDLNIGDSFLIEHAANVASIRSAAWDYARRHPRFRFTVRKVENGGVRVWRI